MALRRDGNSNSSASYKPYDASNSFVKRMANRVTGIIGWRSNPVSESQHHDSSVDTQLGSQNYSDVLHSSTDEETVSPTAKRSRIQLEEENIFQQFRPCSSKELRDVYSPIQPVNDADVAIPSNRHQCIISSTPASVCSPTFKSSPSFVQPDGKNQSSNISLTDHLDYNLPQISIHQRHNVTVPSLPRDVPSQTSYFDVNKSLSGSLSTTNSRRPSFNVDVFSSSSRRLSLSSCENRSRSCISPFYSARTMYGGASALLPYGNQTASRLRSASTSKLDLFSPRSQITMQPVPSSAVSNDQETMSTAARKILDTLETYCSPVMDAKRIPLNESSKKPVDSNQQQPSRGLKRKLPSLSQMMPSTTDLLRLKRAEKIQDSISSAKQIVSSVPENLIVAEDSSESSSDSAELDYTVLTENTKNKDSQYIDKIKRKTESKFDDRPLTPVKLPNAVLQISNLPKFEVTDIFTFSKPLLIENFDQNLDEVMSSPEDDLVSDENVSRESTSAAKTPTTYAHTIVSSSSSSTVPAEKIKSIDSFASSFTALPKSEASTVSKSKPFLPNNSVFKKSDSKKEPVKSQIPTAKNWTCNLCLASNVGERCSKCSGSNVKPAVVEPLASMPCLSSNLEERSSTSSDSNIKTVVTESSTESVKESTVQKEKIAPAVSSAATISVTSGWGDKFKPPADTWECKECFVRNKMTDSKCISCQSPKNNVSSGNTNNNNSSSAAQISFSNYDVWKNLQKPATETWKCDSCWIQNKATETKCVACGAVKESKSTPAMLLKSAVEKEAPKMEFSFGVPKSGAEEGNQKCDSSWIQNKVTETKPVVFGVVNESKSPSATMFKSPPEKETPKMEFSFGISKSGVEDDSQSVVNDITSSTELPAKRKMTDFTSSAPVFKKESANGLPNAVPNLTVTNGATVVSSSSNMFSAGLFAPASVSAGSKLTNDIQPSFPPISKNEITKTDDKSTSKLFATNSFGVSSSSGPVVSSASSLSPSPTTNSIFGNFSAASGFSVKKSEPSSTFTTPTANFGGAATPTFNFGVNATSSQPAGGFSFNGPKAEDSNVAMTPKFGFGAAAVPVADATSFGNGAPAQFNFNARPLTNSIFPAAATTKTQLELQPQLTNSVSTFGNNIFGAPQNQSSQSLLNPVKKSGGFSFTAPNLFTTQPMNNFSNFTNPGALGASAVDENLEQNRLNNNVAPTSSNFVFGNTNQMTQSHNFNLTVPSSFNFGGGNSSIAFSAQPSPTKTVQTNAPPRRIKKAVRRTAK